jgi:photosystem II stability/assembly factor-like uncharacterized protein
MDAKNIWVVGEKGTILYFDGSSWTRQESGTQNTLYGIFRAGSRDLWVVGEKGTILRRTL